MFGVFDISFWFYLLFFFIAVFFAFFIPGDLLIKRYNLPFFQRLIIGIVVGIVLWGWQGFVFGYLNARFLTYPYIIITFFVWLKQNNDFYKKISTQSIKLFRSDKLLVLIIAIGVLIQLLTVWSNGLKSNEGLFFCCGNTSDSLWFIALTDQLVKAFPPNEPGMTGVIVKNYHYWGNLIVADLIRIFKLPLINIHYQYFGLLISIFLGLSAFVFGQIAGLGKIFNRWLVFFLYFGGDLIFAVVSFVRRELNFEMSSLEDGAKFLVNMPRAFSIIVFFVGLSLMIIWLRKKDFRTGFLVAIMFGSLIGLKVYTGFFALSGFLFLGVYFLIKKEFGMIPILILTSIISLIIYLPVNSNAGGLYFTGFYLFENFIVQPWMMLDRLELARRVYLEHRSWIRVLQYEIIFAGIFIVTVFGTKLIGLLQTKKSLSMLPREVNIFMIGGIAISIVIGFFFQQSTGGANSFNFLVSIFILGSIYTALACCYWINKIPKRMNFILVILIVIFTVPRVINYTFENTRLLIKHGGFFVDKHELAALSFLKEEPEKSAVVLIDQKFNDMSEDSPYMSFLIDRPIFLQGGRILRSHSVDILYREQVADAVLQSDNEASISALLSKNNITYILIPSYKNLKATQSAHFVKPVFSNIKVKIFQYSKSRAREYFEKIVN